MTNRALQFGQNANVVTRIQRMSNNATSRYETRYERRVKSASPLGRRERDALFIGKRGEVSLFMQYHVRVSSPMLERALAESERFPRNV